MEGQVSESEMKGSKRELEVCQGGIGKDGFIGENLESCEPVIISWGI